MVAKYSGTAETLVPGSRPKDRMRILTTVKAKGRDGIDERVFQLGVRLSF